MNASPLVSVEVLSSAFVEDQEFDYQLISDPSDREWAESAAGFITFGLGQAVVKVLEAGNLLAEAKQRLPHGQYLPWVQHACGLKPQYASKLIKAAEWSNVAHVQHLDGVTDTATLFLLSADTTTEEVREWFMERCAAGHPPSRREVQERKRTAGQPRQPQPTETLALTILRKGEVDRLREALALAERAQSVTPEQVMAEQRLRDLGKQRFIPGADADFHRMKDNSWIRLPHAGRVDVPVMPERQPVPEPARLQTELIPTEESQLQVVELSRKDAAAQLGMTVNALSQRLIPSLNQSRCFIRNGWRVEPAGARGMYRLSRVA